MTNKKLGNDFEAELCEILAEKGCWVHNLALNKAGQPADILAVKNKKAYLIDAKVVSTDKGFTLSRVEDNQDLSMDLWNECGNGQAWFAMKLPSGEIYMLPHMLVKAYKRVKSSLSFADIKALGTTLEKWVIRCK
jgi:Holliday junction resolvase